MSAVVARLVPAMLVSHYPNPVTMTITEDVVIAIVLISAWFVGRFVLVALIDYLNYYAAATAAAHRQAWAPDFTVSWFTFKMRYRNDLDPVRYQP